MKPRAYAACVWSQLAVLLLLLLAPLSAQGSAPRDGWWAGFAVGYGGEHTSCDACPTGSRTGGISTRLALGRGLNRSVRLGGTLAAWGRRTNGATETMANLAMSLRYYPLRSTRLFVDAGPGLSTYQAPAVSGTGWGVVLGLGYDLHIRRQIFLTPLASYVYGRVGDVTISGGGGTFATGWTQSYFALGLGVTVAGP